MTVTVAPAPGSPPVPGGGASGDVPTARVLDRAGPTSVALRLAVVVLGLLVVATRDGALDAGVVVAAAILLGHAGALQLGTRRPARAPDDGATRLLRGAAVSLVATVASGGWWSPFGAVLAVDLTLTGLAHGYRRAFATAAGIALALVVTTPLSLPLAASTAATSLPLLLFLAASLGGFTHGLTAADDHDGLGHALHLEDANRLAADLHAALRSLPTAPDAVTVSRAALDWIRARVPFVAAVVVATDRGAATLVHAEGAHVPDAAATELTAGAPSSLAITSRSPLAGVGSATAWIPLELRGRRSGLVVVELDDVAGPDTRALLATLAEPLAMALDTARWFTRLSTLSGELERSRIASDLSDRLCQSMAATVFVLDRAAARTGDAELARVAEALRSDVADLGRTLDDLRAHVEDGPDLTAVVTRCTDRAAARAGFVPEVHVDVVERLPRVVEQQLLRALQELLAGLHDATVASVTWRVRDGRAELSVRSDGRLVPPPSVVDRADAIGAVLASGTAPGGAVLTLTAEVPA